MSDQVSPLPEENPVDAAKRARCKTIIQRVIHDAARRRQSVTAFQSLLNLSCPWLKPTDTERRIWHEEKTEAIHKVTAEYLRQIRSELLPESGILPDSDGLQSGGDQLKLF